MISLFGGWVTLGKQEGETPSPRANEVANAAYSIPQNWFQDRQALIPVDAYLKMCKQWVYSCAVKNAEGVASVPLRLYVAKESHSTQLYFPSRQLGNKETRRFERTIGNRGHLQRFLKRAVAVEELVEHPFFDLWEKGNPFLSGEQQKRLLTMHLDLVGDSFTLLAKSKNSETPNKPEYMVSLPPGRMSIETKNAGVEVISGYFLTTTNGEKMRLSPEEVMHIKFPDPYDPIWGLAPLKAVGLEARLYDNWTLYEDALIRGGAIPPTLLTPKQGESMGSGQRKRAEVELQKRIGGPARARPFMIFEEALEVKELGRSQKEMQYREGRKSLREDIAAAFSVPLSMLLTENVNLANAKIGELQHAKHAIRPRCYLIEDQINKDVCSKYDDNVFVAFDDPVPDDREFTLKEEEADLNHAVRVVNEVREERGLQPVPWGDEPIVPVNTAPLSKVSGAGGTKEDKEEEEAPPPSTPKEEANA